MLESFKLLYSLTILQGYEGDQDAIELVDELKSCYDGLLKKKRAGPDADDASGAMVEILLSFASKPSQMFRKMGQSVFGAFTSHLGPGGLHSLIDVSLILSSPYFDRF